MAGWSKTGNEVDCGLYPGFTSTTTINFGEGGAGTADTYRKFLFQPAPPLDPWPTGLPDTYIQYSDSSPGADAAPQFTATPKNTDVISARFGVSGWFYTDVSVGSKPTAPTTSGKPATVTVHFRVAQQDVYHMWHDHEDELWNVYYKDPCVVYLGPGHGWIMLLSRIRVRQSEDPTPKDKGGGPGATLSDVVAWFSDDPNFSGAKSNVTGPYWIVSNIGSLGRLGMGSELHSEVAALRFGLGVPCGVMVSVDMLAVTFVVERPSLDTLGMEGDETAYDDVYRAIRDLDRTTADEFISSVGVRFVAIKDLMALKAKRYAFDDQKNWANDPSSYLVNSVGGRVYVWKKASPSSINDEAREKNFHPEIKIADPQCSRCGSLTDDPGADPTAPRLFFTANFWNGSASVGSSYGIYLARPLTAGTVHRVDGSTGPAQVGLDWYLVNTSAIIPAASSAAADLPADPDPYRTTAAPAQWMCDVGYPAPPGKPLSQFYSPSTDYSVCPQT